MRKQIVIAKIAALQTTRSLLDSVGQPSTHTAAGEPHPHYANGKWLERSLA